MAPDAHSHTPGIDISHQAEDEWHLLDYWRAVYRRRWIAIAAFLIVFVTGVVNTFRATSVYEGTVQILIERAPSSFTTLNQLFQTQQGWYNDDFYETQFRILQSRTLAGRTVDALQLRERPSFMGTGPTEPSLLSVRRLVSRAASLVGLGAASQEPDGVAQPVELLEDDVQAALIDRFLGSVTVSPVDGTRLVNLRLRSTDPRLAADMANGLARSYIEQTQEDRFFATKEANDWLDTQLTEQRRSVEETEAALQRYRDEYGAVAVEDRQSIVVQRLTDLSTAVTRAKMSRIEKQAIHNQLLSMVGTPGLDTFPTILSNQYIQNVKVEIAELQRELAQLSDRFGEKHPQIIRVMTALSTAEAKLEGEIQNVVQSVRTQYLTAQTEERTLVSALAAQNTEAMSLDRIGIEYRVLENEAESNRTVYESLLRQARETGISSALNVSNVRIVDAAVVPRVPVLPRKQRDVMLSLFGGLVLAMGLVFLFENLDNRIKSPQELRAYLGLPYLGTIPVLDQKSGSSLITQATAPMFTEAIRSVHTNVVFSSAEAGLRSVVVTSAGPGDGKTLIASNLAISLAQGDQRVLLVDADMRRPRLHEVFDVSQEPGLSNLLVGTCDQREAFRKSEVPTLTVLPSGYSPPNPVELLSSQRFSGFLANLREQFDYVIFDTPPVLAVADSSVLANLASGVVFVVGADKTPKQVARTAVEQLQTAKAHLIGAVLNRVDLEHDSYYVSRYYRKGYARYYVSAQAPSASRNPMSIRT